MTIQLFYECNEEVYFLQIFYIWTPECPGHFREGEQAYLSIKTGLDAMDTSYDDLLHVKGWPVNRFWCKYHSPEGVPVAAIVNFRFAIFSSESPKDL